MTTGTGSHRRRILAGLLAGAAVALGLAWSLAAGARRESARAAAEQAAVIQAQALADLVTRALPTDGETAGRALETWARSAAEVRVARLVDLGERTLTASSDPADRERGAPPRRLVREEKPYFDLGQELRAAVETNRDEGAAREEELRLETLAGGWLRVAAPVERAAADMEQSAVVGLVQIETAPELPPTPAASPLAALGALAAAAGIFWAAAPALGERRWLLLALAALLLVGAAAGYGRLAYRSFARERGALEVALQARLAREAERVEAALSDAGIAVAPPLAPASWDVDAHRRPRGYAAGAPGAVDAQRLAETLGGARERQERAVAALAILGLAILGFFGLGAASRAWAALRRHHVAYAYTLPAMLGILLLAFFPFAYGIALSFTNSNIYNSDKPLLEVWVGLENFRDILGDFRMTESTPEGRVFNYGNFYYTLMFTVVWTICNVSIGVSVGLMLALILNTRGLAGKPIYRVLLILPWAVPNYITALIWRGMFHQQYGVINQVIQAAGGGPVSWFEHPLTSFAAVLSTNGWLSFPFMMVILLGALQSIPGDLYEAARVDGASRWQQFRSITMPSLKPALLPAVIISVIWTFNMFNIIFLVSEGGPAGSTEILITQAYKIAFQQYRYGYAAAYSTVIFLILLAYGTWQNRVTRATEGI
jgi:arabinogalactan oligomer/maltooligosaccharide transport system permease protein